MRKIWKTKGLRVLLSLLMIVALLLPGCQSLSDEVIDSVVSGITSDDVLDDVQDDSQDTAQENSQDEELDPDGSYTSKEEVALYLYLYKCLPKNFITKNEAKKLGWESKEGNLGEVAPGMSIGGDKFGNYEGQLPKKDGRKYYECDINTDGGYRGEERIVFSNDGLIYYTGNHYKTFELLYGEE